MYIARSLGSARLTSGQARMFRVRYKFRIHFFDRSIIRTKWPKFNKDPLKHAGNLVMTIARQSIRRRAKRDRPSPPGTPPYSHAGTPDSRYGKKRTTRKGRTVNRTPPFKQIFSVPYRFGTSVIVGMVGYTRSSTPVPGLHEHGGYARRKVFTNMGQRRLQSGRWGRMKTSYKPQMVKYPQRPFMNPALMRARSRLPRLWFNSLSNSSM